MRIRLLFFAHLADRHGHLAEVEIATGGTGRDALAQVSQDRRIPDYCRLAAGTEFISWDTPLTDGDEVAVLPPVSGG